MLVATEMGAIRTWGLMSALGRERTSENARETLVYRSAGVHLAGPTSRRSRRSTRPSAVPTAMATVKVLAIVRIMVSKSKLRSPRRKHQSVTPPAWLAHRPGSNDEEPGKRGLDSELGNEGVLTLSATWKSGLMWSHYADEHRGICIEYDTRD